MSKLVTGIHHITALSSDAQKNVDFYAGILGLRLIKKTVNFDAPDVYHLYYGDEHGSPGTIITFFPYPDLTRGRKGKGQVTVTSFSAGVSSMDYWIQRLSRFNVVCSHPQERFANEVFIYLEDPDGLGIELIFNASDTRKGYVTEHIPAEHAIKGFFGASASSDGYELTAALLTESLDHSLTAEKGGRFRYSSTGKPGDFFDIVFHPNSIRGLGGSGTVHHIAFATPDDSTQQSVREKLLRRNIQVTDVMDRQYFHSIYFREPGGVLFEIATIPPGFTVDENLQQLGHALKLPHWHERHRAKIEKSLTPITFNPENFFD